MNVAFKDLRKLIDKSAGAAILLPSGVKRVFRQRRIIGPSDVDNLERFVGVRLPDEYRSLLNTVGAAECFVDESGRAAVEVYDPDEIVDVYSDFFDDPDELRRFLPVACDNRLQEIVVLLLGRPGPQNVLVVSHDTSPDDWPDLLEETVVTSLEAWLLEALSSDGQLEPH